MIAAVNGLLLEKKPNLLVVDLKGLGLEITVPLSTFCRVGEPGTQVSLFTHLIVREDAFQLYGFATRPEKEFFVKLISVSGVGPKLAVAMLSGLNFEELHQAVLTGDSKTLSAIPGIGKKTADRIILELRDKIAAISSPPPQHDSAAPGGLGPDPEKTLRADLLSALVNLGWPSPAAERAVTRVFREETRRDFPLLLRLSLKHLYN